MIRRAEAKDAQSIARIYNEYVLHTSVTFEELPIQPEEMAQRINSNIWYVNEVEGIVRAFASASEWKGRSAYRFTRETSIYVEKGYAGKGLATEVFTRLLKHLRDEGFHSAVATIAMPNQESLYFHEKFGFTRMGILKEVGYKFNKWVDVSSWQLLLSAPRETPRLETERLDLIKIHKSGAEELFSIRSNPEVSLYTRRPVDQDVADTLRFIDKIEQGIENEEWLYWLIKEKDSGRVVGTICLWQFSDDGRMAEVGYELHPDFWGKGYTTEAVSEIVRYAYEVLSLMELRAYTREDNHASRRVLEKSGFLKIGSSEERASDGTTYAHVIYRRER